MATYSSSKFNKERANERERRGGERRGEGIEEDGRERRDTRDTREREKKANRREEKKRKRMGYCYRTKINKSYISISFSRI